MKKISWMAAFFLAVAVSGVEPSAMKGDAQSRMPYARTLLRTEGGGELGTVELDSGLYERVDELERGIRLFTPSGTVVPYVVMPKTELRKQPVFAEFSAGIAGFEHRGNDGIFLLSNNSGEPIDAIRVETKNVDFDKTIRVEGRNQEQEPWREVLPEVPFFDYSGSLPLRRVEVKLPSSVRSAQLRVTIGAYAENTPQPHTMLTSDGAGNPVKSERMWTERQLKVDRFVLIRSGVELQPAPEERNWPLSAESRSEEGPLTILQYTSSREPLVRLNFQAADNNFVRRVTCFGSDDGKRFVRLAEGEWVKLSLRRDRAGVDTLALPRSRYRFYRIEIDNRDNPPLTGLNVQATGQVDQLCFLTTENRLRLLYGASLDRPVYDLREVLGQPDFKQAAAFEAGEEQPNPGFEEPRRPRFTSPFRWIPAVTLTLLLLGLGWALWRGLKAIES